MSKAAETEEVVADSETERLRRRLREDVREGYWALRSVATQLKALGRTEEAAVWDARAKELERL